MLSVWQYGILSVLKKAARNVSAVPIADALLKKADARVNVLVVLLNLNNILRIYPPMIS